MILNDEAIKLDIFHHIPMLLFFDYDLRLWSSNIDSLAPVVLL